MANTKKKTPPVKAKISKRKESLKKKDLKTSSLSFLSKLKGHLLLFIKKYWLGTLIVAITTLIFFWPVVVRIGTYSEGGDAMFNAWTLARDQHCILRENCPSYVNANIYFPHKDTMLYSETQLSAGLVTLPLHFIDANPVFSNNVLTIVSFFFSGWFMYLLAKRLSKNNELYSVLAALVFEFAPFKMAAIWHLQNLSIFCLPLAVLLIIKFFDRPLKRYLWFLFFVLVYQFYASWYQMVFMLMVVGLLLICYLLFKLASLKNILKIGVVTIVALVMVLPLALQYEKFSKSNNATFGITDQSLYSSSVADYFMPNSGTIIGKIYHDVRPGATLNSYNLDSYSYHGIVLYAIALFLFVYMYIRRKKSAEDNKQFKFVATFVIIAVIGFIVSLGPLLKIKDSYLYSGHTNGLQFAIPLPYLLVDKLLPQLSFIRAIGRASVLTLFSLASLLAIFPVVLYSTKLKKKTMTAVTAIVTLLIVIELMPIHRVPMSNVKNAYNLEVPSVYKYIASHKSIDDIVVLQAEDYKGATIPTARAEDVLWSGYDNRNIYNGYSGYTPPTYLNQYVDFVNFDSSTVVAMKAQGIKYVMIDKLLYTNKPEQLSSAQSIFHDKIYEDNRYILFKI